MGNDKQFQHKRSRRHFTFTPVAAALFSRYIRIAYYLQRIAQHIAEYHSECDSTNTNEVLLRNVRTSGPYRWIDKSNRMRNKYAYLLRNAYSIAISSKRNEVAY